MLRKLMRYAIALVALCALSGCAIERLTGPQVAVERTGSSGAPNREDDPRDPPGADPVGEIGAAFDTLRAGGDEHR